MQLMRGWMRSLTQVHVQRTSPGKAVGCLHSSAKIGPPQMCCKILYCAVLSCASYVAAVLAVGANILLAAGVVAAVML